VRRSATIRDVAAADGVSIWTASNTDGNPARVSEAARQRVLAAAQELGDAPSASFCSPGGEGPLATQP
jgi:DNA-binding LacI/PurR family transcriptional regulator